MLLIFLFSVITSIVTVSGIPVDFLQDEYNVEGFIPNDPSADSPGNVSPIDDTGVNNQPNDLPTYVFPDALNPDAFGYMRDKSDVNSFSPSSDEPSSEPNSEATKEPNNEPTNDSDGQSSEPTTTNLIGESSPP